MAALAGRRSAAQEAPAQRAGRGRSAGLRSGVKAPPAPPSRSRVRRARRNSIAAPLNEEALRLARGGARGLAQDCARSRQGATAARARR